VTDRAQRRTTANDLKEAGVTTHMKEPRVSRQEELLYGPWAGLARIFGDLAVSAEQARTSLERALAESREADSYTLPTANTGGDSPQTMWLESLYERLWPLTGGIYELHVDVAEQAIHRYRESRSSVDSQPSPATVAEVDALARSAGYGGVPCSNDLTEGVLRRVLARAGWTPGPQNWSLIVGDTRLELIARRIVWSAAVGVEPEMDGASLYGHFDIVQGDPCGPGEWMVERPAGAGG
jgi:hypothetical protein